MVIAVLQLRKAQPVQNRVHPPLCLLFAQAIVAGAENHVLIHRWHKHLVIRVLQHKADLLPDGGQVLLIHGQTVYQDLPLAGKQTQQELHNGGFSGSVGADQAHRLPVPDGKAQIFNHGALPVIGEGHILKFDHFHHPISKPPKREEILKHLAPRNRAMQTTAKARPDRPYAGASA